MNDFKYKKDFLHQNLNTVILQDLARFLLYQRPDLESFKINIICKILVRSFKINVIYKILAKYYKITVGVRLGIGIEMQIIRYPKNFTRTSAILRKIIVRRRR